MKMFIPIIIGIVLLVALRWLRKEDRGGSFGQAIRNSDWHAWRSAVTDKEKELAELKEVEPKE